MEASPVPPSSLCSLGSKAVGCPAPQVVVGKPVVVVGSSSSPSSDYVSASTENKPGTSSRSSGSGGGGTDLPAVGGEDRSFSKWAVATGVSVEEPQTDEADDFDGRGARRSGAGRGARNGRAGGGGGGSVEDFFSAGQYEDKAVSPPSSFFKDVHLSSRLIFIFCLFGCTAVLYGYEQTASRTLLDSVVEYFRVCDKNRQADQFCVPKFLFFFLSPLGSAVGLYFFFLGSRNDYGEC